MNNPTITVSSDTSGLADLGTTSLNNPVMMVGILAGGIAGYKLSKKHRIIGAIVASSLGGWLGILYKQGQDAKAARDAQLSGKV